MCVYCRDVLNYVKHQGSRATAATPTTIVKWRTPPTVGEMWSHPPEQLVWSLIVYILYSNTLG